MATTDASTRIVRSGRERDQVAACDQYAAFSVRRGADLYYTVAVRPKGKLVQQSARYVHLVYDLTSEHRKRWREALRSQAR